MENQPRKPRILVVEDSPTQAQELRLLLEQDGFEVACAPDGEQGLIAANAEHFDIVLSDIIMPGISGYELCRKIKSGPRGGETAVVLLTLLSEPEDVFRGLECGADNFLTKPYEPQTLSKRIRTVLANRRLRAGEQLSDTVKVEVDGKLIAVTSAPEQLVDLLLSTFEELREAKEGQRAMEPALQAVEASIRERTDLLSVAGTEIRTPMNSIIGLTGLLLETDVSAEQRNYLEGIKNSAESLLKIVNDILDFSKVKAGTLELETADFELRETLANAVKTFAREARRKGLELVYEVLPDVPNALVGDPDRLWQIVVNLVGNAVKFTQCGEVSIKVERDSSEPDIAALKFTVRDTGIGVSPEKQATLLQPVAQIGGSTTRKYSGAGLGLAISSRLVELMGGRIWFESEEGRGSKFYFTAKFALQAGPQWPEFPHPRLDGLNVLLVDDNDTTRRILKELLLAWRTVVIEAKNGAEALTSLRAAPWRAAHTSVVLLDAEMPEMSGFEVLEQIRRESEIDVLVVVMLSSADESRDLDRCRFLAADAYVQKPVSPVELQDAIVAALRKSVLKADEHWRPAEAAPAERRHRPLRILLAEDDRINQLFAVRLLEKAGHAVRAVANGEEALVAYRQNPFDLVLMDVQMPVMDGFEATVHIRQYERQTGVHTPIIAMTAWAEKEDRQKCLAAGMDGYVAKPIQTAELFAAMAAAIPDLLASAGESTGAAGGAPSPSETVLQRTI